MSGFEVAGLVLGALPLIISALEHYESSLDRAKAFYKYEEELENAMSELWMEHSYYEMTLQLVLKGVVSNSELEEMMASPDSPLWRSEDLTEELELKLGPAYKNYLHLVKKMELQLKSLSRALDIDRHPETANDLAAIIRGNYPTARAARKAQSRFQFRRRIKFTMKKDAITKLIENIGTCNQRLERFIEKAEKLDQSVLTSKSKPKSTMAVPLQAIHDYAGRLYHVLSKAWSTCAHHSHCANLLLEHRMIRQERRRGQLRRLEDYAATFTVSFESPVLKAWHLAEVKILEEEDTPSPDVRSQVKFSVSSSPCTPSADGAPDEMLESPTPDLGVIDDLCSTLHSYSKPTSCCGFALDVQGILRGTYEAAQRSMPQANRLVTLEEVLAASKAQTWRPLTEDDRRVLAVILASSFLQLHSTPWVGDRWNKTGIVFLVPAGDRCRIDVKHPFLTKTYAAPGEEGHSPSTIYSSAAATASSGSHDDNVNLLTLAKILLEIRLNDQVENLRRSEDLGPDQVLNEAADVQTLRRWIKEEQGNLSFELNDAVRYCMKTFADPGTDLRSLSVRQDVVDNVVVPLLEELHVWREGPAR